MTALPGCAAERSPAAAPAEMQPRTFEHSFSADPFPAEPAAQQSPSPAPAVSAAPDPTAPMPGEGLEVRWWVVDDTNGEIASTLASFVEPPLPEDTSVRERWRAAGLRLVRVPRADFPAVEAAWTPRSQRFIQWVGWAPQWTEVFRGRRVGDQPVALTERSTYPPRGVARILARCWPAPPHEPDGPPQVRLELAFQVEPPADRPDPFEPPRIVPEETRGPVLRELTASLRPDPDAVLILTAEDPAVERTSSPFGPAVEKPISFGEAMLATPGTESDPRRHRAVIILICRATRPYRLLP